MWRRVLARDRAGSAAGREMHRPDWPLNSGLVYLRARKRRRDDAAQFLGVVGRAPDGGEHVRGVRAIALLARHTEKLPMLGQHVVTLEQPQEVRGARRALRDYEHPKKRDFELIVLILD